jgi:hypothetical protein
MKDISETLRDLRTMIIDKTEMLFRLDKEKGEQIHRLHTEIELLKEQKMPPRIFKLESWRAYALGAIAVILWLATFGLSLYGVLKK